MSADLLAVNGNFTGGTNTLSGALALGRVPAGDLGGAISEDGGRAVRPAFGIPGITGMITACNDLGCFLVCYLPSEIASRDIERS